MANLALVNQVTSPIRAAMSPGMVVTSLQDVMAIGKILAASRFFKDADTESKAVAKILRGWELGIPPVASLENIHVMDGKTSLSVHLVSATIDQSGMYRKRVIETTNSLCIIEFHAKLDGSWQEVGHSQFTIEDAKLAGLLGKTNWQKYPKAMLYARALTQGARLYCSSVFLGHIYVPEELGAETDESGEIVDLVAPLASLKTNREQISDLLNELQLTDVATRQDIVNYHLNGKKASELSEQELAELLIAIRKFCSQPANVATSAVDVIAVSAIPELPSDQVSASTIQLDNRTIISNLLDELAVVDVTERQQLVKQHLTLRRLESLSPGEIQQVLEGIRQSCNR
jgi:hypothetical protein